jgi:hypothetical protein
MAESQKATAYFDALSESTRRALEDVKRRERIEISVRMGASVALVITGWWLAVRSRKEAHAALTTSRSDLRECPRDLIMTSGAESLVRTFR